MSEGKTANGRRRPSATIGDMCSRLTIPCAPRNYSNPTKKLLQPDDIITPKHVRINWVFVDRQRTPQRGRFVWRIITPIHFVITPIYVGFHWDSVEERTSGGLAQSTLRLKYIIIQLQAEQKLITPNHLMALTCRNLGGRGGKT